MSLREPILSKKKKLKNKCRYLKGRVRELKDYIARQRGTNLRLAEVALKTPIHTDTLQKFRAWLEHYPSCGVNTPRTSEFAEDPKCTCGLAAVLASITYDESEVENAR